jgi:hypothetical protein
VLTVTNCIQIILASSCLLLKGWCVPPTESIAPPVQKPYYCYFIPPKGWDLADKSKMSPRVKICFLGKSSNTILPSVNLATEKVNVSLKAYIDIIKSDCEKDPNCSWRDLGKYNTPLGEGRLTEREMKIRGSVSRQVQLIVIKDNRAYVLTAAALKEEFSSHYKTFEAVLKSLTITDDLTASVISTEKKELLQKRIANLQAEFTAALNTDVPLEQTFESKSFQKKCWQPFKEKIINDFTEMGAYWQILLLRDIQYQLLKRTR